MLRFNYNTFMECCLVCGKSRLRLESVGLIMCVSVRVSLSVATHLERFYSVILERVTVPGLVFTNSSVINFDPS